ncbi:MAG TPA: hypothetical protein PLR74_13705, partial [Agriterribacter sp.]|nr:hypothetical protein [Agriterribacter sp.]
MIKWTKVFIVCIIPFTAIYSAAAQDFTRPQLLELLALDGERNIMQEENFGIANGYITTRVNYTNVGTISGLFAPPYASSDFLLQCRLFGEKVATKSYRWYPFEVLREGEINGVEVKTTITLLAGLRAALFTIRLNNSSGKDIEVPVQFCVEGGLNDVDKWEFKRPDAKDKTNNTLQDGRMIRSNSSGRMIIGSDVPGLQWFELGSRWDSKVHMAAGQKRTFHVVIEMGGVSLSTDYTNSVLADPSKAKMKAQDTYIDSVGDLITRLPRFHASDQRLEKYYYRSLAVLLTNKWHVPEFILHPYYGSGGVIGGCVGNYLWEFGLPAQIFPLYDPQASKAHIKQFLKIDITRHFLFNPVDGAAGGVWYQVNQDKIIELIYFYVLHTGDREFLNEVVEGRTVYEHVLGNALFGDDVNKPVKLIDYGEDGENHLELRRGYPYRGIMPDVNGLRYLSYIRAYQLSQIAGKPAKILPARAAGLKQLLKERLWSARDNWFFFESQGKKDIRMTNFMYTLIGTGVFDAEVEKGLLSHLNDREFLGDYGIHSISRLDPAYDQVDIDHGGGGSYVAFPPLICQRFYNAGYRSAADDLLQRHLWWGERLPYWGDSQVANYMGYREDTPLQSDFSAISGAQSVIFGLFGVKVLTNNSIEIGPVLPSFCTGIKLEGLKLRGKSIDIHVNSAGFSV